MNPTTWKVETLPFWQKKRKKTYKSFFCMNLLRTVRACGGIRMAFHVSGGPSLESSSFSEASVTTLHYKEKSKNYCILEARGYDFSISKIHVSLCRENFRPFGVHSITFRVSISIICRKCPFHYSIC